MTTLFATLFIVICVLLIIVVLLQKGRGGGLGAAFGGMGSSAFGTKIGDVFTWVTIVLVALFLLLAIGTQLMWKRVPTVPTGMSNLLFRSILTRTFNGLFKASIHVWSGRNPELPFIICPGLYV